MHADAAAATVAWLMAELRLPGGAFASSLDADTVIDGVHHEGASYQWTVAELQAAAVDAVAPAVGPDGAGLAAAVARAMNLPGTGRPAPASGPPLAPPRARGLGADPPGPAAPARPGAPCRPGMTRWWPAGTPCSWLPWPRAPWCWSEPAWLAAAVELGEYLQSRPLGRAAVAGSPTTGAARGIKGLLEDYAACARGS